MYFTGSTIVLSIGIGFFRIMFLFNLKYSTIKQKYVICTKSNTHIHFHVSIQIWNERVYVISHHTHEDSIYTWFRKYIQSPVFLLYESQFWILKASVPPGLRRFARSYVRMFVRSSVRFSFGNCDGTALLALRTTCELSLRDLSRCPASHYRCAIDDEETDKDTRRQSEWR